MVTPSCMVAMFVSFIIAAVTPVMAVLAIASPMRVSAFATMRCALRARYSDEPTPCGEDEWQYPRQLLCGVLPLGLIEMMSVPATIVLPGPWQ